MTAEPVPAVRVRRALGRGVPAATESPWTLDVLGQPALALIVRGMPAPQGSKDPFIDKAGNARVRESSKAVKPWRTAVQAAVMAVLPPGWKPLDGPLIADMVFTWPKPDTAAEWEAWHPRYPDLDKLLRSTFDGLKQGGAWADDARAVALRRAEKLYPGCGDPDALPSGQTGAVIRVWTLPAHIETTRREAAKAAQLARRRKTKEQA